LTKLDLLGDMDQLWYSPYSGYAEFWDDSLLNADSGHSDWSGECVVTSCQINIKTTMSVIIRLTNTLFKKSQTKHWNCPLIHRTRKRFG